MINITCSASDVCVCPAAGVWEAEGSHAHPSVQSGEGEGGRRSDLLLGALQQEQQHLKRPEAIYSRSATAVSNSVVLY